MKNLFRLFFKKDDKKSCFIFYKIIDHDEEGIFKLQCINTSGIFSCNLFDIIFDKDILYSLHPVQACFIGIRYGKIIKDENQTIMKKYCKEKSISFPLKNRYGQYYLKSIDRNGVVCFVEKSSKINLRETINHIISTKDLIEEFDSSQAFYLGMISIIIPERKKIISNTKPYLTLVKG